MKYFVVVNGTEHEVEVVERFGELAVSIGGKPVDFRYHEVNRHGQVSLTVERKAFGISIEGSTSKVAVTLAGQRYAIAIEDERERAARVAARARSGGAGPVKAVMPGVVVDLLVAPGQVVAAGQPLLILEAMKMQNEIVAAADGRVTDVHVTKGQAVSAGERLVTMVDAAPAE